LPPEPIRSVHLAKGAVPLPPPRPFDLSMRPISSTIVATAASSSSSRPSTRVASAHAVAPPRRPDLHASAERALSGAVRLPPKKPTTGALDRIKPAKTARG
jgi:hypothetical protein